MKRLAIFAVLPLATSALVSAQAPGRFAQSGEVVAGNLVAAEMGLCLLKRDRRDAVQLVDLDPSTPAYRTLATRIERPMIACLNGQRSASISSFYLRGAISEALLRENDAAILRAVGGKAPVPARRVEIVGDADPVAEVVACAVKADPANAGAMIVADAATAPEMDAFRKLAPSLQSCVPASGSVTLRRPTVRPGVAIALYRLGRGAVVSPSSNGAN